MKGLKWSWGLLLVGLTLSACSKDDTDSDASIAVENLRALLVKDGKPAIGQVGGLDKVSTVVLPENETPTRADIVASFKATISKAVPGAAFNESETSVDAASYTLPNGAGVISLKLANAEGEADEIGKYGTILVNVPAIQEVSRIDIQRADANLYTGGNPEYWEEHGK